MNRKSVVVQSPGRINIIGEHTDYNEGFVLPAAIDKHTSFRLTLNGTENTVNILALNLDERHSFDLQAYKPLAGGWQNYVMGVVHELQKEGGQLEGFDGEFEGTVPIGSGMSSSAALECSLAFGLNELFELGFEKWTLIKASQMAEHNFVGIKCGIMDQFASIMGKKDHVMRLDCRSLEFEYFPFDLGEYQILLLNTNISHALASSEYNTRRAECEEGVYILQQGYPHIQSLRDASLHQLEALKDRLNPIIYRRCRHVISENQRVTEATQAMVQKDVHRLGSLIYDSHWSLQKDYEVSCPELDFLVDATTDKGYVQGSRMMGGGFGGCTLNIIERRMIDPLVEEVSAAYKEQFDTELTPYVISIEDGAKRIS